MKRTIRLNESELKRMISESVRRILYEADGFKNVDNLNDYVASNGLQMRQASKFQRINARPAQEGERITTIASDGVGETRNVAEQGDWVVNNVSNPDNQWIIDGKTFAKKYVPVNGQQGVYMPKGGPMNAAQINEPISFTAPWGERMNIDKGGYILQDPNNPNDIYGISGKDFDSTYRFNENRILQNIIRECVQSALNEVEGYGNTMQKAGNKFNQNTIMGRIRSKLQPQKYQQYQRIQQQGNQMGQQAADNINAEREKVPIGMSGGYGPYDRFYPKWDSYAKQQGVSNHGNRPRPEDYGLSIYPNEWYQERNKENFKQWEKDLEDWDNNIYPNAQKNGKALYNQRITNDQARINKYGTGGRVLKPMDGYDTSSYQDAENAYDQQRQAIKNGQM